MEVCTINNWVISSREWWSTPMSREIFITLDPRDQMARWQIKESRGNSRGKYRAIQFSIRFLKNEKTLSLSLSLSFSLFFFAFLFPSQLDWAILRAGLLLYAVHILRSDERKSPSLCRVPFGFDPPCHSINFVDYTFPSSDQPTWAAAAPV